MKKEKIMLIVSLIIMSISSIISVGAVSYLYNSKDVSYDNKVSKIKSTDVQGAIDELYEEATNYSSINTRLTNLENNYINTIYPIGSIYMSTTEDTVAKVQAKFGGTWQKIEGKFLLSSSSSYSAGSTGGSADAVLVSHTHTFTGIQVSTNSTGGHSHNIATVNSGNNAFPAWALQLHSGTADVSGSAVTRAAGVTSAVANHSHSVTAKGTNSTEGVSATGKNMPPYLVVYMYKRIS